MAFVIKNARDHVVHVDGVPIGVGQKLVVPRMTGPVSKALDVGDVRLYDGSETQERRKDVKALKTVLGDKLKINLD